MIAFTEPESASAAAVALPVTAPVTGVPPGPLAGLEHCPVTCDGWLLPPSGYPWKVARRHYIFWEAIFAINFLWISTACYNLNMTTLWSTFPEILWMLVAVRGSVLFTSLYARVCSVGMTNLVTAVYSANFALTTILFTHMLLSGAQYSPISVFTAFELLYEIFVLAMLQLPAYRWPLRFWMLRREPVASAAEGTPDGASAGTVRPATP